MIERYRDYDPFAWLYATHWGHEFHAQAPAVLQRLFLHQLPRGAKVLDLCCGDGRLTAALDRMGFRMTGLDGSERILEFARERAPGVPFLLADARNFELTERFDAVISTFDALNHIMSPDEFAAVCRQVAKVLIPGGFFAFDLNREEAFTDLWPETSTLVEPGVVSISHGTYNGGDRLARCNITMFRLLNGAWQRSDFTLREYAHREEDVLNSLFAAGFADAKIYDASNDLGMYGNIGKGRNYFLARLP